LVREGRIDELEASAGEGVVVSSPQLDPLGHALANAGGQVTRTGPAQLRVKGMPAAAVGHAAFTAGVELHELRTEKADLEQLFFSLTQAEFTAPATGGNYPQPVPAGAAGAPPVHAPPVSPPPTTAPARGGAR